MHAAEHGPGGRLTASLLGLFLVQNNRFKYESRTGIPMALLGTGYFVTQLMGCFGQGMMILVVALSHLLLAAVTVILFRAYPVAETALALGGPFCHRLACLIAFDCLWFKTAAPI